MSVKKGEKASSGAKNSSELDKSVKKYIDEPQEEQVRKKKKTTANRDIRRGGRFAYNEFVERKSLLDQVYQDSSIYQSPFKGVMRISLFIAFIFVFNTVCVSLLQ